MNLTKETVIFWKYENFLIFFKVMKLSTLLIFMFDAMSLDFATMATIYFIKKLIA